MDSKAVMELLQFVANVAIVPLCTALWGMQGRLSRIEGMLSRIEKSKVSSTII